MVRHQRRWLTIYQQGTFQQRLTHHVGSGRVASRLHAEVHSSNPPEHRLSLTYIHRRSGLSGKLWGIARHLISLRYTF